MTLTLFRGKEHWRVDDGTSVHYTTWSTLNPGAVVATCLQQATSEKVEYRPEYTTDRAPVDTWYIPDWSTSLESNGWKVQRGVSNNVVGVEPERSEPHPSSPRTRGTWASVGRWLDSLRSNGGRERD